MAEARRPTAAGPGAVLGKPFVTAPIIGASRMQHLDEAIAALQITLTPDEVKALEEPYQLHPILGHS
jgi:aryl-alcohol dehydrogenase (NADP+)